MQITADISKIWKAVQRDLIFIFNVLLGSAIVLSNFWFPRLQKILLVLHKMVFLKNEAA